MWIGFRALLNKVLTYTRSMPFGLTRNVDHSSYAVGMSIMLEGSCGFLDAAGLEPLAIKIVQSRVVLSEALGKA